MDDLQANYKDDNQNDDSTPTPTEDLNSDIPDPKQTLTLTETPETDVSGPLASEELSDTPFKTISSSDELETDQLEPPNKKHKNIVELIAPTTMPPDTDTLPTKTNSKKNKKKNNKGNNVWTKSTSRKGKKRTKSTVNATVQTEDNVLITPIHRYNADKTDDGVEMEICLSKVFKAEKVELSEDRLSAGSCKGYRMVRATRGVTEGAWYFEVKVVSLGESGHTRLGWSTEKGDLQAPVGYDGNSYGFRDVDGSKVHKALREGYGDGYGEGDVIGFYVSLPEGDLYAPKQPQVVLYKGQKYAYASDVKEEPLKVVPGSEICFFKNGICQGSAFKDLQGGRYYPAASMYTLPNHSNCVVKFNFGPDFEAFPEDFGERPIPKPMVEVPYHGFDGSVQNGNPVGPTRMCPMLKVVKEND